MKVMIIGVDGSPYAGGMFVYVYLDDDTPMKSVPHRVPIY